MTPPYDWSDALQAGALTPDALNVADDFEPPILETSQNIGNLEVSSIQYDYKPFPLHCVPEPMRAFIAEATEALTPGLDPVMVAWPALSATAAAIGNALELSVLPTWREAPILFTAVVAEPGGLKTPAATLALKPLRRLEAERHAEHVVCMQAYERDLEAFEATSKSKKNAPTGARAVKPVRPVQKRHVLSDVTVERLAAIHAENPKGMLCERDELSGWFGSHNQYKSGGRGADETVWLDVWSSKPLTVDRVKAPVPIYIPRPCVSVTGGIQPDALRRALSGKALGDGTAARFLTAWPPRVAKQWPKATVCKETLDRVEDLFRTMASWQMPTDAAGVPQPGVVGFAPDAAALSRSFVNQHGREGLAYRGAMQSIWSKAEAYAFRFALVFHGIQRAAGLAADPERVSGETLAAAIELATWAAHETMRCLRAVGVLEDSGSDDNAKLCHWIARKGGRVTASQTAQGRPGMFDRDADRADAALEALVNLGLGRWEPVEPTGKGGRPTRVFVLAGRDG